MRAQLTRTLSTLAVLGLLASPALADDAKDKKAGLYKVDVAGADLKVGADGKLTLTISPKTGYKFNKDYPTTVKVTSGSKVKFAKAKYKKSDGDVRTEDKKGVVTLSARGAAAGTETITAEASFSICDAETCHVLRKRKVEITVSVK